MQPALAVAIELRELGHAVQMCISPNFVDWARSLDLEVVDGMGHICEAAIRSVPIWAEQ